MTDFSDKLAALTSAEAVACPGNPERFGAMIERLCAATGFTIAMASGGDAKTISNMVHGAEGYIMEEVVQKSRVAQFMTGVKR